jgi:hypothetical protein
MLYSFNVLTAGNENEPVRDFTQDSFHGSSWFVMVGHELMG